MSTSVSNSNVVAAEPILSWQVHPARQEPHKLVGIMAAAGAMGLMAYLVIGHVFPAIALVFALLGTLSDFLLPVTYTITETHVSSSTRVGKRIMAWADVRRCYLDDNGIKLSPLGRRSRLEAYRGVYLPFGDRKDEVIALVKRLRPQKDV